MKLLEITFSRKMPAEDKLDAISRMGIVVSEELKGRVSAMCNLSQGLIEEGRMEGRMEGREEERVSSIKNVMSNLKTTADKAMDILGIPASERGRYIALL